MLTRQVFELDSFEVDQVTITRVGTNEKYASGWDSVFGGKKAKASASKSTKAAKPTAKSKVVKKAAAASPATKKVAKKASQKKTAAKKKSSKR